jgi:Zn-dependent metalloprotease
MFHPKHVLSTLTCAALAMGAAGCGGADRPESEGLALPAGPGGETLGQMGFSSAALGDDGTPIYLGSEVAAQGVKVRSAEDARGLLRSTLARAFRLAPGTDFAVQKESRYKGWRFYRMQQVHGGLPVVGGEAVVQAGADGAVMGVVGSLAPDLALPLQPEVSAEAAMARALRSLAAVGSVQVHEAPALQVLRAEEAGRPALAYRAVVEYVDAVDGLRIDEVFANASAAGEPVLARHSRVYTALSRKIHDFKSACMDSFGFTLPGGLAMSEGGTTMDTAVQGAYDGTGATYWFYKHLFERDSFDDMGATLVSTVNLKFPAGAGCSGANAAWIDQKKQMVYGTGDGTNLKNLAQGLDVTAHELTHAVTARTSNLTYSKESGALNEAMSDVIGAATEAWVDSGGSSMGNPAMITPSDKTWKIGEEVVIPGGMIAGDALRYMNNPTADKVSYDYYPERYMGTSDNGGVHLNSGIANLAFYLMSQGGTHPRSKTTVQVPAISIEYATALFYLSNTYLLTSSATFKTARYATAHVAHLVFGRCSAEWLSSHMAWDAVGVPGGWNLCPRPPQF